jgi:hypothetical protein
MEYVAQYKYQSVIVHAHHSYALNHPKEEVVLAWEYEVPFVKYAQ